MEEKRMIPCEEIGLVEKNESDSKMIKVTVQDI